MRELFSNSPGGTRSALPLPVLGLTVPPDAANYGSVDEKLRAMDQTPALPWYALTVKYQHERTVAMALTGRGFEAFSPMYRARRQWSDRTKEIELPLFEGYVFCRFPLESKVQVLNTPAISRVVQFGGIVVAVPDAEIEAIRAIVASKLPMRPWPHLRPGDRVRIERGPLRGVVGVLLKELSLKEKDALELVVTVELLQRSVAVRIEAADVIPQPLFRGRTSA